MWDQSGHTWQADRCFIHLINISDESENVLGKNFSFIHPIGLQKTCNKEREVEKITQPFFMPSWLFCQLFPCVTAHRFWRRVTTESMGRGRGSRTPTLSTRWPRSFSRLSEPPAGCGWRWSLRRNQTAGSAHRSMTATYHVLTPRGGGSSRGRSSGTHCVCWLGDFWTKMK